MRNKKGDIVAQTFIILIASGILAIALLGVLYGLITRGIVTSYIVADKNKIEKLESYLSDTCSKVSDVMPEFPPAGAPLYTGDFRWSTKLKELKLVNEGDKAYFNLTWSKAKYSYPLTTCNLFGNISIESPSSPLKIVGGTTYKIYRKAYYNSDDNLKYINVTFVEKVEK